MTRIVKPTEDAAIYNIVKEERQEKRRRRIQVWHAKEEKTFAQFMKEYLKEGNNGGVHREDNTRI